MVARRRFASILHPIHARNPAVLLASSGREDSRCIVRCKNDLAQIRGNKMHENIPDGARPNIDQRVDSRIEIGLAVDVDGDTGWVRDVSATGVYFEADASREVGSIVNLTLEVNVSGETLKLFCEGKVVRIHPTATGKVGVAARLRASFFADRHAATGAGSHSVPAALED